MTQMNLSMKQEQTHKHKEQTCDCQGRRAVREGMDWEFGVSKCKLLHTERINNKILLYGTGNYIQYSAINHNGKEYDEEYIYIYIHTYIYV